MTTFDSTKRSLPELLKDITTGKTQLQAAGGVRRGRRYCRGRHCLLNAPTWRTSGLNIGSLRQGYHYRIWQQGVRDEGM
ncbi:hypothetical protein [Ectothiorhodospira mobilis]|uniref:hypothetical protein n=1 Tax=Ectothiorhodospira mobilis TaxID=195064 RepID=UPI0015A52427|nr:hypothetical protein [Ectothiorhodospira mobilis]